MEKMELNIEVYKSVYQVPGGKHRKGIRDVYSPHPHIGPDPFPVQSRTDTDKGIQRHYSLVSSLVECRPNN